MCSALKNKMAAEGESDGGFKRENFSSYTKPQLIDYIQQQAESLERYEARFRGRIIMKKNSNLFIYSFNPLFLRCC